MSYMHIEVRSSCWSSYGLITDVNGWETEVVGRWIENSNPIPIPFIRLPPKYLMVQQCTQLPPYTADKSYFALHFPTKYSLVKYYIVNIRVDWYIQITVLHLILSEPQFPYPEAMGKIHRESLLLWRLKVMMYVNPQWLRDLGILCYYNKFIFNYFPSLPLTPKIPIPKAQASHVDFTEYFIWRLKKNIMGWL